MRHLFIINPNTFSDLNTFKNVLIEIENCFPTTCREDYYIYISRYPRDAVAVINRYLDGCAGNDTTRVYAVGGDGTLLDCLNGVIGRERAELTGVPYGVSCDFLRSLGDGTLEQFRNIAALTKGEPIDVDCVKCGTRYAINSVAIGVGAESCAYADEIFTNTKRVYTPKRAGRVYVYGVLKALLRRKGVRRYEVEMDGKDISGDFVNIALFNGKCNGASMTPAPEADYSDGLLHVVLTRPSGRLKEILMFGGYAKGEDIKAIPIEKTACKKIRVRCNEPFRVSSDTETFMSSDITVEVIQGAIKFCVPTVSGGGGGG